jgi:hypothetical protein
MRALIDAKIAALPTEQSEGGDYLTDEAIAQMPAIMQEANTEYERLCVEWWQPGPFAAWLMEYRSYLTDERVPAEQDLFEQTKQQWEIQGVDTSEARSTAAMDAAHDYLQRLEKIYAERKRGPASFKIVPGSVEYGFGEY